jgi:hypothetical protein
MGSERCKTVRLQYVVIKKFGKKDLLVREESELSASNVPIVAHQQHRWVVTPAVDKIWRETKDRNHSYQFRAFIKDYYLIYK